MKLGQNSILIPDSVVHDVHFLNIMTKSTWMRENRGGEMSIPPKFEDGGGRRGNRLTNLIFMLYNTF